MIIVNPLNMSLVIIAFGKAFIANITSFHGGHF